MTAKTPAEAEPDEEELGPDEEGPEDDRPMTFWEHLDELRKRIVRALLGLVVGCGVGWAYREEILEFMVKPYCESWVENDLPGQCSLHFPSPADIFISYFNVSLIAGAVLAAPFISYQIWSFIAPGLYAREKRYVIPFVLSSTALFVGGGYVGYVTAFKVTFGYLLGLSGPVGGGFVNVVPTVMMADYISFVMKMLLGFGIIFQIPIASTFLALTGLVTHTKLIRWARYYIFGAFLASAVLTPPDYASMFIMAIPAVALYFVSICLVYVFQRKEALQADIEAQAEKEKLKKEVEEREAEKKRELEKLERARKKAAAERAAAQKAATDKAAAERAEKAAADKAAADKGGEASGAPADHTPADHGGKKE